MKTFCLTTMIVAFLLFCGNPAHAQAKQLELNQIELVKQFIGSWKVDLAKDTVIFWDAKAFGTGFETYYKSVSKERTLMEGKQLFGYDKKIDKYLASNLIKDMDVEIFALWFTSNSKFEMAYYSDISNPNKASFKVEGEFKSPNEYVETTIVNGKPMMTYTYIRVK